MVALKMNPRIVVMIIDFLDLNSLVFSKDAIKNPTGINIIILIKMSKILNDPNKVEKYSSRNIRNW